MVNYFKSPTLQFLRILTCLVLFALLSLPNTAKASACTAILATSNPSTTTFVGVSISYFNNSPGTAQKFTPFVGAGTGVAFPAGATNLNTMSVDPIGGLLWSYDRSNGRFYSLNLNTYQFSAGVQFSIPTPPGGNLTTILGAAFDPSGNYFMVAGRNLNTTTVGEFATPTFYFSKILQADLATGINSAWQTATYAVGSMPLSAGGDLAFDSAGTLYQITNGISNGAGVLNLLYTINTNTFFGTLVSTYDLTAAGAGGGVDSNIGGLVFSPTTQQLYAGGAANQRVLYAITPGVNNAQTLLDNAAYSTNDLGACTLAPTPPTVTKSFSPTYNALAASTTTLVLSINNPNTNPIWLTAAFQDVFPSGMTIATPSDLNLGTCGSSTTPTVTNVITATSGSNSVTFSNGNRIPAGGCTITLSVTAPASLNNYNNTIPAGALVTTAGSNANAATAVYKVGTDFAVTKTQGTGTVGPYTSGALTVPGGSIMQYVLTITNSSVGGTGSASFQDTLPVEITPVLTVTATLSGGGGGSCVAAPSVVGGATQINGTLTNVIAGATCTVVITTRVSAAQSVATPVVNNVTLTPAPDTSDSNTANNSASVTTTIGASANLAVSKTNGTNTLAAGSTTSYTLTFSNFGPADAPGTLIRDNPSSGLLCLSATCTASAGAVCPAPYNPGPGFATALLTGSLSIPTFNANSNLTFVLVCRVRATGLDVDCATAPPFTPGCEP